MATASKGIALLHSNHFEIKTAPDLNKGQSLLEEIPHIKGWAGHLPRVSNSGKAGQVDCFLYPQYLRVVSLGLEQTVTGRKTDHHKPENMVTELQYMYMYIHVTTQS